jgi:chain length determinant protein (polysaccharide antigen chain regulator)
MNSSQTSPTQAYYQDDEINLADIFAVLLNKAKFIIAVTVSITVISIIYVLSLSPTYSVSSSFLSPNQSSIIELNKSGILAETNDSVYRQFINNILSSKVQRQVFDKGNYLGKLNTDNAPIDDVSVFFGEFVESIQIHENTVDTKVVSSYEKPIKTTFEGNNPEVISTYINELTVAADNTTINELLSLAKLKIDLRLKEISKERSLLLSKAKADRLATIERIQEEDLQKTNEIQDKIERLRVKAKKDRENKIVSLKDAANIASSLGITQNNFNESGEESKYQASLTVAINDNKLLPNWYLYGSEALLKEIEVLQNRTNDDPFVAEIVTLQNALREIETNQTLRTLEQRVSDSPFIAKITELDNEDIKLNSLILSASGISSYTSNNQSYPPISPIKPNKKLIVVVATIAGFMFSILYVFIASAVRTRENPI